MASIATRIFSVRNMMAGRVARAVVEAKKFSSKSAAVAFTSFSSKNGMPALRSAIAPAALLHSSASCCSAGADSDVMELQLKIDGMVCDGCSSRVLEALQKLPGVNSVQVDLEKGLATVEIAAATQTDAFNALPKLIETVTGLGFEAAPHFE